MMIKILSGFFVTLFCMHNQLHGNLKLITCLDVKDRVISACWKNNNVYTNSSSSDGKLGVVKKWEFDGFNKVKCDDIKKIEFEKNQHLIFRMNDAESCFLICHYDCYRGYLVDFFNGIGKKLYCLQGTCNKLYDWNYADSVFCKDRVFVLAYDSEGPSRIDIYKDAGSFGFGLEKEICISNNARTLHMSPSKKYLAISHTKGEINIYSLDDNFFKSKLLQPLCKLCNHEKVVHNVIFSPDENWIVSASKDKTNIWKKNGDKWFLVQEHKGKVYGMTFLDNNHLYLGLKNGDIRVMENKNDTWTCIQTETLHKKAVTFLEFKKNNEGVFLLTSSKDGTVKIWQEDMEPSLYDNENKLNLEYKKIDLN